MQLHDVTMENMPVTPSILHTVLQECKSLIRCTIRIGSPAPESALGRDYSIYLPDIQSFTLYHHRGSYADWDDVLTPFLLPSLKKVTLSTHSKLLSSETYLSLVERRAVIYTT
jgi:hypothetical protein